MESLPEIHKEVHKLTLLNIIIIINIIKIKTIRAVKKKFVHLPKYYWVEELLSGVMMLLLDIMDNGPKWSTHTRNVQEGL